MITSLKEDFASLEHTYFLLTNKTFAVGNIEQKVSSCFTQILCTCICFFLVSCQNSLCSSLIFSIYPCLSRMFFQDVVTEICLQEANSYRSLKGNESTLTPDGVTDLLSMQTRIRAVEKLMMEELERHVEEESLTTNVKAEAVTEMTEYSTER